MRERRPLNARAMNRRYRLVRDRWRQFMCAGLERVEDWAAYWPYHA